MWTRKSQTGLPAILLAAGLVLAISPATAEVSVNTDMDGKYLYTSILVSESPSDFLFWTPVRDVAPERLLNPEGDLFGDGRPAVIDDPRSGSPVVVWARATGGNHVLAWSAWEGNGWSPPRWLHRLPAAAGDFDPVLATDSAGAVHLVWWREEGGQGRVFWSQYLGQGGWTPPHPISPRGVDARFPAIDLESNRRDVVWFNKQGKPTGRRPLSPWQGILTSSSSNEKIQSDSDGLTDDPDVLP